MLFPRAALTALALTLIAPNASAQTPPPAGTSVSVQVQLPAAAPPPAGYYAPPPAGYAPPPAGYAPPPGYLYPSPGGYVMPAAMGERILPYKEGYLVPEGYHRESRVRTGLVIGGAVTFGVMYSFAALSAVTSGEKVMAIPLLGPFLELGRLNLSGPADNSFAPVVVTLLVIDGLGQVAGAAMLIGGLAGKKEVLVRNDVARTTVRVLPLTMGYGGMGAGIGLVGTM